MEKWGQLMVFVCICTVAVASSPSTYSVGGETGWTLGVQMSTPHLHPGDSIHFSYPAGQHDVYQVSEQDYYGCKSSSPWSVHTSGNDYINLPNSGTYYFICSYGNHCNSGMKLAVHVG